MSVQPSSSLGPRRALLAALLSLLGLAGLAGPRPAPAELRHISETDLFGFVWAADPQPSADGKQVAFVHITVNDKRDDYDTTIWAVPAAATEPAHPLTTGKHDSEPRWSPDGQSLAFVRATDKDGKTEPGQLWVLPIAGGEPYRLTDLPRGASHPVWSPDGTRIAFLSHTNAEDLAKRERQKQPGKPDESSPRETDVRVVTRAVYRSNEAGYLDLKHPQHLWVIELPHSADEKVEPQQLTRGRFDENNVFWSADGARIYFTSDRVDEPYYELARSDLYAIAAHGGEPGKIAALELDARSFAPSPDGLRVAFIAQETRPVHSYSQPHLWVMDLTPGARPRNLTARFDRDVGASVFGDNAAPRGAGDNPPAWTADGRGLIESYTSEGRTNLALFDAASGAMSELTQGAQAVLAFRATPGAHELVYCVSTATRLNDLYTLERGSPAAQPRQLTHLNDGLFGHLELSAPEELWFKSFDGKRIQAWLQKPPDFDARRRYPLILDIHGGPHTSYGQVFDHEFQWMAAKGYVVLYPNPRGSIGYGQEFGNIIQYHYPGDDFKDLMAGVDAVIQRGYIDAKKLGVTGGSGGGLLTNWVVGHTTRFAAAVSQRDIASWADWWYTADFTLFQPNWFRAPPFDDPRDYTARSPITYIKNVTTPLMLILGETDSRTPPEAGGDQMFRALKFRRVSTVMVRFPNETHELSRSGQPWHRVERLQHIVGWFDHWLEGATKPEYDVAPASEPPGK